MFEKQLPARPNLEQYKKQAKDLARAFSEGALEAQMRLKHNHPRFHKLGTADLPVAQGSLTDAQLVLAREHGFESWPKFAHHIEMLHLIESVANLADPVATFLEVATIPRHTGHGSGSLDHAEMILARYPQVAGSNIYTAAVLADEAAVRGFLVSDPNQASAKGGPLGWDPLTYLCFSRYLRLDKSRSEAFVQTARALLDAGASANTGWYETIDQPNPRQILESAIYGAAGIAQHPELTRLLLERGADPNDEETPYHVPEGYDNTVMQILLESGRLNAASLGCMLVRKADWHDEAGVRMVLEHGADPNLQLRWGGDGFHHALRRDNALSTISLLLDHGADPDLPSARDGRSVTAIAARRGRGDVLTLLTERSIAHNLQGVERLIAACALGDREAIDALIAAEPAMKYALLAEGGVLLVEFAGNGNLEGVRCLLDLGVSPAAVHTHGDGYWDVTRESTALHVAAWRAWHPVVMELISRGALVNALDGKGRSSLALAVKACIDSYWINRRKPDSVSALLKAGATTAGIDVPTGYDAVDELLLAARTRLTP